MRYARHGLFILSLALASALLTLNARAQNRETDTIPATAALEEIVVTATRCEERLQDVPVSVTAFTQERLDAQGVRDIDALTRLSPGVTFRNGSGTSANYNHENSDLSIRGIESTAGTLVS